MNSIGLKHTPLFSNFSPTRILQVSRFLLPNVACACAPRERSLSTIDPDIVDPDRWNKIEDLFASVLNQEPAAREAYLAEACAGDSALLAQVRSLLEYHEPGARLM